WTTTTSRLGSPRPTPKCGSTEARLSPIALLRIHAPSCLPLLAQKKTSNQSVHVAPLQASRSIFLRAPPAWHRLRSVHERRVALRADHKSVPSGLRGWFV